MKELPSAFAAIPETTRDRLTGSILDLIGAALHAQTTSEPIGRRTTLVRVKQWIEAHLSDELSAERVAVSCGLSIRYINRLFEPEGASLMRYVWGRRLARCHDDLIRSGTRKGAVSDIAVAWGFSDFSHFSRAYRARYGCAPSNSRPKAERT